VRKSIVLVVSAISIAVTVAASGGPAARAGGDGPMRDGGRGVWFVRACGAPGTAFGACGAQVVTNSNGTPLASSAAPPPSAYGPAQFHTAYNLPSTASPAQTIAIVDAYDDPNIEADLGTFSTNYGLSPCTTASGCFKKVNQTGGTTYPVVNASWALEVSLDVETAHAMCQNCKILLVEATSSSLANLGTAENEAVALGANVISNSWGSSEYSTETSDETRYFNHPGVAIIASTGDNGYGVQFPASSRYVTAVGGTTLNLNSNNTWKSESAWAGAGSGCSAYIPKPVWQTDKSCPRRTVADVSADADPNTGAAVYDSVAYQGVTGWFQVGGTSLAAPLIASAYALSGNAGSVNAGSAPYANPTALHDVTSGTNGNCGGNYLCSAGAGYDGPTGLGTPNGLAAFGGSSSGSPPPPPASDFSVGLSPSSSTVTVGTNAVYNVTVSTTGTFTNEIDFSETGLPNAVFAPAFVNGAGSSALTVTTSGVTPGTYPFTITGTSGSTTHTASGTLVIQAAQAPPPPPPGNANFSISVSPTSRTILPTSTTTYTVTITPTNGFNGPVTLSATGFPAGLSGSFSPNPTTSSSTFTVTASNASGGRFGARGTVTITGTSGSLSHSTTLTLLIL
jgi:hypothetical protein